jgi:hypothetical protein
MGLPGRVFVKTADKMMKAAKIPLLDWFDDLPHASVQNRVLMHLHIERAPTGIVDALVVPGADAKESELALQHSMVQHPAHEVIAVPQPKPYMSFSQTTHLESRSEPFVRVEERDPFGFEGKVLSTNYASSENCRPIGNSEPSPPALAISIVLSVLVESTTTISAKPSSVARHSSWPLQSI